jgi:hypothetical protein
VLSIARPVAGFDAQHSLSGQRSLLLELLVGERAKHRPKRGVRPQRCFDLGVRGHRAAMVVREKIAQSALRFGGAPAVVEPAHRAIHSGCGLATGA